MKAKLSVIIPVYNEETTIERIIGEVTKLDEVGQIIIVDDGSTDRTKEILSRPLPDKVETIKSDVNRGKGWGLRQALPMVAYEIIVIQDADLEYYPGEYKDLLVPILRGEADVVYGNRLSFSHFLRHPGHFFGNKFITSLVNILNRSWVTDAATGFKMFRRKVIEDIYFSSDGFEFCIEFTTKILKAGYKIYSVPVTYSPRSYSQGKKISWRDRWKHIEVAFQYALKSKTPKGPSATNVSKKA